MFEKWAHLEKKIWYLQISSLSPTKRFFVRLARIALLTLEGFRKSQIQQNATTLTYYSLMALVPAIALMLAVARGFSLQDIFERRITRALPNQPELAQKILEFASQTLKGASQGVIAGIGIVLLVWSLLKMLTYIEDAMNQIWNVAKGRSFARKFSDYLALLFFIPILFFLATGLTIYLSNLLRVLRGEISVQLTFIITFLLFAVPILITGLLLTFIYIFIPNTRIRFAPALIAGVTTAALYQIIQLVYVYFQIGVTKHNAIYGAFAAIPLFLIWVHLSWIIVLLGAKFAFAIQNMDAYAFIVEKVAISHRIKQLLSLLIAHHCIKKFCACQEPSTVIEISNTLSIPLALTKSLVLKLIEAEVLATVKRGDEEEAVAPARDVDTLTIKNVLDMIDKKGEPIPMQESPELKQFLQCFEQFDREIISSKVNYLLKEI